MKVNNIMTIVGFEKDQNGKKKATLIDELINHDSEINFLNKYLVFVIAQEFGEKLIDITQSQYRIINKVNMVI